MLNKYGGTNYRGNRNLLRSKLKNCNKFGIYIYKAVAMSESVFAACSCKSPQSVKAFLNICFSKIRVILSWNSQFFFLGTIKRQ